MSKEKSFYLKTYKDEANSYLFSTRTGAIVGRESIPDDLNELDDDEKADLAEVGILVDSAKEEIEKTVAFPDDLESISSTIVISVTEKCNLSCPHCFFLEKNMNNDMSMETIERVVAFVKESFLDFKTLKVIYYGGEALMNLPAIEALSERLHSLTEGSDSSVNWEMTVQTNAVLLTPSVLTRLKAAGINKAMVSVDGLNHDKIRTLKHGEGTLEIVLKHVENALDMGFKVGCNGTYSESDWKESYSPAFFDLLCERNIGQRISAFNVAPRFDFGCGYGCHSTDEAWIYEPTITLREEIMKKGIKVAPMKPPVYCGVETNTIVFISPNGFIYPCAVLYMKEYEMGSVFEGIKTPAKEMLPLANWKNEAKCRLCKYLPICYNGCSAIAVFNNKSKIDCRKKFFDNVLEPIVKQDIKHALM